MSKKSDSITAIITAAKPGFAAPRMSAFPMTLKSGGLRGEAAAARLSVGKTLGSASFQVAAARAAASIPRSTAPFTLLCQSTAITERPRRATRASGLEMRPTVTGTPEPGFTRPAFTKPMNAMKAPIPTLIACLSSMGMTSIMYSRRPRATSSVIMRPSQNMTPIAVCQLSPIDFTRL